MWRLRPALMLSALMRDRTQDTRSDMSSINIIGRHKTEVTTPCLLLDMGAADRNIKRMADFFAPRACDLRPHVKTHKSPLLAHRQIEAGAIGISCAKLQDARVFVESGIDNILIANEIVDVEKMRELAALARLTNMIVCVDHATNARDLSRIAEENGIVLDVLVEVNIGLDRCGTDPGLPTLELVRQVSQLKGLKFRGLMGYEGGVFIKDLAEKREVCGGRNQALVETRELVESSGFPIDIVSAGGSNTYDLTGVVPGVTEIQAGSYVTMDDWNKQHGIDFEQAITVMTTVISVPAKDRAITDAGLKAISTDHGLPRVIGRSGVTVGGLNEEHGKLLLAEGAAQLAAGDKLEIVPTHGCTTVPLYDHYVLTHDDHVIETAEIITRGAVY